MKRRSVALVFLSVCLACGDDSPSSLAQGGSAGDGGADGGGPQLDAGPSAPTALWVPSNDPGAPDMLDLTVHSQAMGRDVLVRLILPASYATQPSRHYPVLYLLHGANDSLSYRAWSEQTNVETLALGRDLIVAMPEGGQCGWYSDWAGQCNPAGAAPPGIDNQPSWETFHTSELPAVLRQYYRANTQSSIAGLSMGGLGATSYAARHPGMYSAAASYSGALHSSNNDFVLKITLTQAGCANTDAVWGPVAQQPDVWAAHDPYLLASKLSALPIYVSAGTGAPGPLDPASAMGTDTIEMLAAAASRDFSDRLTELGSTRLVTHFYGPGTHSWPYWSRELASSFAMLTEPLTAD
ncbi:MAG: hypothetical protein JWN04_2838 [Myxococcaceae bacterium]|nr:hypothetical protein [Myxococcaceae bacterium]